MAKIRSLLLARRSGATSCLICLERVRATDPVWDCKSGCHQIFHLICIQSWARQAIGAAAIRSLGPLSGQHFPAAQAEAEDKACWHCPKCRSCSKSPASTDIFIFHSMIDRIGRFLRSLGVGLYHYLPVSVSSLYCAGFLYIFIAGLITERQSFQESTDAFVGSKTILYTTLGWHLTLAEKNVGELCPETVVTSVCCYAIPDHAQRVLNY